MLLKDGEQVSEQELIEFCRDKLAGYKRPRTIEYVSDFPRTATGKILKRTLRQSYWQGQERAI